jgi:hypothetical protein
VGLQEKVELACTCSRGVDHWYSRPGGAITPITPIADRAPRGDGSARTDGAPRTDGSARALAGGVSPRLRRSPAPAARAS